MHKTSSGIRSDSGVTSEGTESAAHLVLPLDDDDGHRGGRPAVLRGQRLVTVPQDNNLKGGTERGLHICIVINTTPSTQLVAASSR